MTITRQCGNYYGQFTFDGLTANTKIFITYATSAYNCRQTCITARKLFSDVTFDEIETKTQEFIDDYSIGKSEIITKDTAESTIKITSGSSTYYAAFIIFSKDSRYDFSGIRKDTCNFYSQTESEETEDDEENYYLSSTLASGKDFSIDVCIAQKPTGMIFAYQMGAKSSTSPQEWTIEYSAENGSGSVTIKNELSKCTTDTNEIEAEKETKITLTTESESYLFFDTPTITINDDTKNFTVSDDKQTAIYTLTAGKGDTIKVTANAIYKFIDFETDLTSCTIDTRNAEIGETVIITLTALTDFYFYVAPTITINDETKNFTVSDDKETATFIYTGAKGDNVNIYGATAEKPKTATIEKKDVSNVSILPDVDTYTEYDDLTLIFSVDDSHSFSETPYIQTNIFDGTMELIEAIKISDKKYTLTIPKNSFNTAQTNYVIYLYATAIYDTETINKYGLITLYKPTRQNLLDLTKVRFMTIGETDETDDLGKYITSLKRIYIDAPEVEQANIILGGYDTEISAGVIDNDEIELNLGTVNITGLYQNEMDIKHSTIEIILPFIGIETLDVSKIMNKTINIKYKCNLISGVCVAFIYLVENTDETEKITLINKFNGSIGFDVPYILKPDNETNIYNGNANSDNIFKADPKINIYTNKKADENIFVYDTFFVDKIANIESGFIAVKKIISTENSKTILDAESRLIENILKSGITI
jgi:hypothetical protein